MSTTPASETPKKKDVDGASPTPTPTPSPAPASKQIVFKCRQCEFKITRLPKDLGADCPKCCVKKPYVSPQEAKKSAELRKIVSPGSKLRRTGGGKCLKHPNRENDPNAQHEFEFGKCTYCSIAEGVSNADATGKTLQGEGKFAYPGGKSDCIDGKHMFMFGKCKKCSMSELEHIKQKRQAQK